MRFTYAAIESAGNGRAATAVAIETSNAIGPRQTACTPCVRATGGLVDTKYNRNKILLCCYVLIAETVATHVTLDVAADESDRIVAAIRVGFSGTREFPCKPLLPHSSGSENRKYLCFRTL